MEQRLKTLQKQAIEAFHAVKTLEELREKEIYYLGRKGELTSVLRQLKDLTEERRKEIGSMANSIKLELQELISRRTKELEQSSVKDLARSEWIDITAPGKTCTRGHMHPLFQLQYEVEEIFTGLGFSIADGPELESEYYNFDALNMPAHHPSRDMQDTFWLEDGNLMRTQTSPVQVRAMEKYGAPLRMIVPGRTFRYEATDASHENTFYQIEGLMIDEDTNIGNMVAIMREALRQIFEKEIQVRIRPGFFPFVEPGMEMDLSCLFCAGKGCRICKNTGWMEFMGCGMVHPFVLRSGGVDPSKYQGFAFGFGLNRLAMLKYHINDIRMFMSGDLRFIRQF